MPDDVRAMLDDLEAKHLRAKDASRNGELPDWGDVGFSSDGYEPEVAEYMATALNATPTLLRLARRAGEMEEAAREVLSAAHLRTHGFPEGDISDLDFSKMLPAIVRLDAALSPAPAADKPANEAKEKGNG